MAPSQQALAVITATLLISVARAQVADNKLDPRLEGLDAFEARVHEAEGAKLYYRLLKPLEFGKQRDKSVKYPLVLFLHGAGECGSDNLRQLFHGGHNFVNKDFRRRHPAFVVVPQCPADDSWFGPTLQRVLALVEALKEEFPVDADRIYGIGLSMGGEGTWSILADEPGLLAAAAPICGGWGAVRDPSLMKNTPIWAFHGSEDTVVPPEESRTIIAAIRDAGGQPIYTEYEGVGHDSWTETFNNRLLWDWMFAQRRR